jgi:hypothetical protein
LRVEGGGDRDIHLELEEHEAELFRSLLIEMSTLLEAGLVDDPIKNRLFPRAYEDDDDEAKYKSLIGLDLEKAKRENVKKTREMLGDIGPVDVSLDRAAVEGWLRLLTDLRLAIGTRLEVTEDDMAAEVDPTAPEGAALSVLHWLGWIQESLLERATIEVGGDAK